MLKVIILDETGAVVVTYIYDAWGNHAVLDADGKDITDIEHIGNLNPFRYRGYYYDVETGLYFLQTRYYDPETGRFISQDSVEYAEPKTVNGINLYAYCGNNPVMNVDPSGESFLIALLVGTLLGMAIGGAVNGIFAYNEGRRGVELVASILGGAIVGGAMGAVMVLGGAAGLAATGATVAGFSLSTTTALISSVCIGAGASLESYLIINGVHKDKSISLGGATKALLSGGLQAGTTFAVGYLGGLNGLFNKLGNFRTMDSFYVNMFNTTGKINLVSRLFYSTSILFGESLTKMLYLSSFGAGSRYLIKWLFDKLPS